VFENRGILAFDVMKTKKEKFKAEYCPKCKDKLMIETKQGDIEVFECENCKFKKEKK
jgi:predicted  nucleic acid-binding Zn ribbon protein